MNPSRPDPRRIYGFTMIEVLVTLAILMVGLLGLAGLMVQSQRSEMESYQRVQALILLRDMAGRLNANRNVASCYAFTTNAANGTPYVGGGAASAPACTIGTAAQNQQADQDLSDWNNLLTGSAETYAGSTIGAMVGARGCVSYGAGTEVLDKFGVAIAGTGIYTVAVAWQGLGSTAVATPNCAQGLYGDEAQRRVVSMTLRMASLVTP